MRVLNTGGLALFACQRERSRDEDEWDSNELVVIDCCPRTKCHTSGIRCAGHLSLALLSMLAAIRTMGSKFLCKKEGI